MISIDMPKKALTAALVLALCLALCACGAETEAEAEAKAAASTEELTEVVTAESIGELESYTALKKADLTGSTCYDELLDYAERHPEVEVIFTVALPGGIEAPWDSTALDLSALSGDELAEALDLLEYLPQLETVTLPDGGEAKVESGADGVSLDYTFKLNGKSCDLYASSVDLSGISWSELENSLPTLSLMPELTAISLGSETEDGLTWEQIGKLHDACPQAVMDYSFTLYGKAFNLSDAEMNLSHVQIDDEGKLVGQITRCMLNLTSLDMDSCGVSNEKMAELRDSLPNASVVWRVSFGTKYSVRTDVERILASRPGVAGELNHETVENLKYCTKVKYIDLGHNNQLDTIDFVNYMPDLEVAIFSSNIVEDFSPLANCPNLEYLELFTTRLHDLSPLSGLTNLKHLNICYDFAITDISPLYSLTQLERLWIGRYDPIPPEQIEEMQQCAPNCVINSTTMDPTDDGWRFKVYTESGFTEYDDRYALLREQFGYYEDWEYSFYWNDPLY